MWSPIYTYRPELVVTLPGRPKAKVKAGESVKVKVELDLPSDIKKLTKITLSLDGSALDTHVDFQIP